MKIDRNKISIRVFKPEYAPGVSRVVRRVEKLVLARYYAAEIIHQFYLLNSKEKILEKSKNRKIYIALKGERVVGIIGLKQNEVKNFYVDPQYLRQGIGRKLYEYIEKIMIRRKYSEVAVFSSLYAVPIYQKFGFKRVKKEKKEIGGFVYYDVLMRKKI